MPELPYSHHVGAHPPTSILCILSLQGGASVEAVCRLAYNQLLAAQQSGAHEHVVALATALWQLLPLADQHLRASVIGAAQQARILLLATQALLDLHSKQPDR